MPTLPSGRYPAPASACEQAKLALSTQVRLISKSRRDGSPFIKHTFPAPALKPPSMIMRFFEFTCLQSALNRRWNAGYYRSIVSVLMVGGSSHYHPSSVSCATVWQERVF